MNHKHVYNLFQINSIVSIISIIVATPIVCLITYLFSVQDYITVNDILYISLGVTILVLGVTSVFLILTREKHRKKLKSSYAKEFTFCTTLSTLAIFGFGILFIYLGGPDFYVPHVILPLGIFTYSILYLVGNRFFNVKLIRR